MGRPNQTSYYVSELKAWARSKEELEELLGRHTSYGRKWEVQIYSYKHTSTYLLEPVVTRAWKLKPVVKEDESDEEDDFDKKTSIFNLHDSCRHSIASSSGKK